MAYEKGMAYAGLPGSSASTNQSRSCANVTGRSPSRAAGTMASAPAAVPLPRRRSISAATSERTDRSKTARSGSSTPNTCRTREITRVASSECPPSSKKLSSAPTRSRPSTSAHTPASTSSVGVRGATYRSSAGASSGAGSALRSSLPLGVSGNASMKTNAVGSMYSGRRAFRCSRSAPADTASPSATTTYPTSRRSPGTSSRTSTTASRTAGCSASRASISPSSMRNPRTFTWKSVRPRYSSSPSGRRRIRSITRYIRPPGAPNGQGRKRSAVIAGRFA